MKIRVTSDETKAIAPSFPPRPINLSFKKTLKIAAIKGAMKTMLKSLPIPIKDPQKISGRFKALNLFSRGHGTRVMRALEAGAGVPA